MTPLTKKQAAVLTFLNAFAHERGYMPTLEEIGHHFGLSSLATIHKHLENLRLKGFIRRHWNHARSIEIVAKGEICPTCGQLMGNAYVAMGGESHYTTEAKDDKVSGQDGAAGVDAPTAPDPRPR